MDWNKIADGLSTGSDRNWLKPGIGQHIVKFLSEGEEYTYEWEGDTIEKVRFEVEVNGEKFDWGVTKGKTANSLFGQIALVGKNRPQLTDSTVNLVVKGSGKETTYTITEALTYMVKEEPVKN